MTDPEPMIHVTAVFRVPDGWSRRTYAIPVAVMRELSDFVTASKTPRTLRVVADEVAAEIEQLGAAGSVALKEEW